jgi:hypothetical protein
MTSLGMSQLKKLANIIMLQLLTHIHHREVKNSEA